MIKKIWFFITIGLFLTSFTLEVVAPEFSSFVMGTFLVASLIALVQLIIFRKSIIHVCSTRFFKNGAAHLLRAFLVLCILGVINFLAVKNDRSVDLTTQKYHSLSEQSKKIVKDLRSTLKITLFAKRGDWDHYLAILDKYEQASDFIVLEALDIDKSLPLIRKFNITENGSILINYKGREVVSKVQSELTVTNSIIKAIRSREINVYYTTGHGELDFNSKEKLGASFLKRSIESVNYNLRPLDLIAENIPSSADAIIIVSPRFGFLENELKKIEDHLNRGGNLMVLLQSNLSGTNQSGLYSLIEKNKIEVVDSIVIDRLAKSQGSEFTTPIINKYSEVSSITKSFKGRVLFPLSTALKLIESQDFEAEKLLWTTPFPATWAERDIEGVINGKANFDDTDLKGPITLGISSFNKRNQSKLVVFGSGGFVSNAFESQSLNFNLFLNALSWALDDEGIISISRPGLKNSKVMISLSQETLILFFLLIFLPTLFFIVAFVLYRKALNS
jgi:ABC-type uncharacterized transport system involved in gliding motility auxiliary subunit